MASVRSALRLSALLVGAVLFAAPPAVAQQVAPPPAPAAATLVPPRLLSDPGAPYPTGAQGDATVTLTLTVDEDGVVNEAIPVEPNEPFSSHAADAARAWRFEPATRDGKPVSARIRVEVVFHAPTPDAASPPTATPALAPAKKPDAPAPQEVHVLGDRAEPSRSVSLTRTEVRQIPGVFGDPFRAIEVMPGVTPIISGLPFFFVRGAPPGDVGYYLDGIRVPYLFHIGAGPSVIHPALVDHVDLYPGGYPARFGRFSGGIVAGESAGPSSVAHGEGNIRLFDSGAFVEAPFADGRGDVAVGGRYSYTAALLSLVQSQGTLNYWDYQGRVGYELTPRDRISAFAFGARDFLGDKTSGTEVTVFDVTFHRLDLRYDHRLDSGGTVRVAVTGGIDRTGVDATHFLEDHLLGARLELEQPLSSVAFLRAGMDLEVDRYKALLSDNSQNFSESAYASLFPTRTDLTFGPRADVVLSAGPRLEITPGIRLDSYSSQGATAIGVDPRLATRTVLTKHLRMLAAMGIAHQLPSFVVPIPGFQPGGLDGGLQTAAQESVGLEADLNAATTMTATVFHNAFFNLSDALSAAGAPVSGCGAVATANGPLVGGGGSCTGDQQIPSTGDAQNAKYLQTRSNGSAYGLELFLKRKLTNKIGGFISYTLSRSERTANEKHFVAPFDRTHVANAALAYDLGRNWRAGTRVIFYTGLPRAFNPSDPGTTRLEPFFRVDLRLEKRWQLGPRAWVSFVVEWMNATLSKESVGSDCTLSGCTDTRIGPITIPSIGLEGGF